MSTYRVSFRLVHRPHVSMVLTYWVNAQTDASARTRAYAAMVDEVEEMLRAYTVEWLRRTTVVRIK